MNVYADTSVLFSLFHPRTEFTLPVNQHQRRHGADFIYPAWLRFELRHTLNLTRGTPAGETAWRALQAAERTRLRAIREDWLKIVQLAHDLSLINAREHECGALDVLHVAAAQEHGAAEFWTCDAGQGEFARACGLRVVNLAD